MRAVVCVKRVVDFAVKIRVNPTNTAVDVNGVKMSINPFCEIAMEAAQQLKEQGKIKEIIAVTMGDDKAQEVLRTAMALGADQGILLKTGNRADQEIDSLAFAKQVKALCDELKPDLIFMGKQSIDGDANQSAQMLAGLMDIPQATFASKIEVTADNSLLVEREVDAGLQTVTMPLPAVVSCDLRLNTPRNVTLPALMKAKKKSIDVRNVELEQRLKTVKVEAPPKRSAGVKVASVDELIEKLKTERKCIV